jgi:hypothetical protein
MPSATIAPAASSSSTSIPAPSRNAPPAAAPPRATDDEILGIVSPRKNPLRSAAQLEFDFDAADSVDNADGLRTAGVPPAPLPSSQEENSKTPARGRRYKNLSDNDDSVAPRASDAPTAAEPAHLRAAFDTNPELRAAWRDASAYRESFATPEAAREATALLADVNHMDALFFSRRPEDHAALARAIVNLDPAAFASLAHAMAEFARSANSQTANVARLFRGEDSAANAGRQGSTGPGNQIADAWQPSQISSVGARRCPFTTQRHSACPEERRERSVHGLRRPELQLRHNSSRGARFRAAAGCRGGGTAAAAAIFVGCTIRRESRRAARIPQCCKRRRRRRRRCRDRIAGRAATARRRREECAHACGRRNLPRARCNAALESAIRLAVARRIPLRLARRRPPPRDRFAAHRTRSPGSPRRSKTRAE